MAHAGCFRARSAGWQEGQLGPHGTPTQGARAAEPCHPGILRPLVCPGDRPAPTSSPVGVAGTLGREDCLRAHRLQDGVRWFCRVGLTSGGSWRSRVTLPMVSPPAFARWCPASKCDLLGEHCSHSALGGPCVASQRVCVVVTAEIPALEFPPCHFCAPPALSSSNSSNSRTSSGSAISVGPPFPWLPASTTGRGGASLGEGPRRLAGPAPGRTPGRTPGQGDNVLIRLLLYRMLTSSFVFTF